MKRALAVVVCAYGGLWLTAKSMQRRYASREWPERLGTVAKSVEHYPDVENSKGAGALAKLMPALGTNTIKEPVGDAQPAPAELGAFFARNDGRIDAAEVQSFDYVYRFAASYQAEAWMMSNAIRTVHAPLARPYLDACAADAMEALRASTERMVTSQDYDRPANQRLDLAAWNTPAKAAMQDLMAGWHRLARFQTERQATDEILALRPGADGT